MKIQLLVEAGNAKPGPGLSQQLGPLGINIGKLLAEVNKASSQYKGMKVPVIVDIDPETKDFKITLKTPPTAELIKKELGLDKGAGDSKIKVANLAVEQAVKIAKVKEQDMLTNSFKAAVKSVVATCTSLGVLVEGKEPKQVTKEIDSGEYADVIEKQITEVSVEKKKLLQKQFREIEQAIKKRIKEEEAAKAAEEAKKVKVEKVEEEAAAGAAEAEPAKAAKAGEAKPEKKPEKAEKKVKAIKK